MSEIEEILKKMDTDLSILEMETDDTLLKAESAIHLTKLSLENLRNNWLEQKSISIDKEIHFFKHLKPQVYSKLIYYVNLFKIEGRRPRGSKKVQIKYLNIHIDKLQVYVNDNIEFYQYYRGNKTHFDEYYFVREKENIRLFPDTFHFFMDKQFSTSHDSTVATILAYDMLVIYLRQEIDKLENNNGMETTNSLNPILSSKLFWTGSKTDLIELIYALDSSGSINSGTADIKEVASVCEQIFNIDLGNYYHTFIEIRSRKSNSTKFINSLKASLLKRLKKSDE